jgi:signal transduction histidine kinase/ActR/RegA family two-component response regulator
MEDNSNSETAFYSKLLEIIPQVQDIFLKVEDHQEAFDYLLNQILELTQSEFGFIGEVIFKEETGKSYIRSKRITNIAWNDTIREYYNKNYKDGLILDNPKSLFGRVLVDMKPLISNDVSSDPRASGLPPGHPKIDSFLGLPIMDEGCIVATVGIANRLDGYDETIVRRLDPLLKTISSLLLTLKIRKIKELEERKQIETYNTFTALVDLAPGMLYQFKMEQDGSFSFPYSSKGIEEIYGVHPEDVKENITKILEIIYPEDVEGVFHSISVSAEKLTPWNYEYRVVLKNGEIQWLRGLANPVLEKDNSILWTGLIVNITNQKKIYEQLILSKKEAEDANQIKSLFLANVSHEIRTPLNGIFGFTELLSSTELNSIQKEYINNIIFSTETLLTLINDLLDLSKIESDKIQLNLENINISEIAQSIVQILKLQAIEKNVDLQLLIDNSVPKTIVGDGLKLNQVLTNLLSNAIKFTNFGKIKLTITKENDILVISIEDTGIGIPTEQIERIFQPFYQVDSSLTKKYKGTGLGLSITKKILDKMHAPLEIKSIVGQGSKFIFKLPILIPEFQTRIIETISPPFNENSDSQKFLRHKESNLKKIKILIAEDNDLNLSFAKRAILKYFPMAEIFEAGDGLQALEIFKKKELDLILMDIQMPIMDGYMATQEIRQLEKTGKRIPIVSLSAGANIADREKGIKAGMDEYLTKPIHVRDLLETIESFL